MRNGKSMESKISVIVPAYNVEKWLKRCIESIIHQSHKNLEIIIINDGSSDGTAVIIDEYAAVDSRIIAVHQENCGLVKVRERGIKMATGNYIGFVDGDDAIDYDMYEKLLYNAQKYNADISHCGLKVIYPDGHQEDHYGTGDIVEQTTMDGVRDLLQGIKVDPSLCNKIYRRDLLKDSCLDATVLNNEDLLRNYVAFRRADKIIFEDFCGYQYWSRENSMSNDSKVIERVKSSIKARKCILDHSSEIDRKYAKAAWISCLINSVNTLTFRKDTESVQICKDIRKILKDEKPNIKYLIKRQQIAARLIILSPQIHRIIYKIYTLV